jgi:hypothetical protein
LEAETVTVVEASGNAVKRIEAPAARERVVVKAED